MIHINTSYSFDDFKRYGIQLLTGEACSYSLRMLCDLNEDGVLLLTDYFGLKPESFAANWNTQVNGKKAIASVMLPRGAWWNELALFALFHVDKVQYAVPGEAVGGWNGWCGFNDEDLEGYSYLEEQLSKSGRRNWSSGRSVGGRNVHEMTGRIN